MSGDALSTRALIRRLRTVMKCATCGKSKLRDNVRTAGKDQPEPFNPNKHCACHTERPAPVAAGGGTI